MAPKVYRLQDPAPPMALGDPKKLRDGRYFVPLDPPVSFRLEKITCPSLVDEDGVLLRRASAIATNEFLPNLSLLKRTDAELMNQVVRERARLFPDATLTEPQIRARMVRSMRNALDCRVHPDTVVTGPDGAPLLAEDLSRIDWKSADVDALLTARGLWFTQREFGVSWDLEQVRLRDQPEPLRLSPYQFEEGDEGEAAWDDLFPEVEFT